MPLMSAKAGVATASENKAIFPKNTNPKIRRSWSQEEHLYIGGCLQSMSGPAHHTGAQEYPKAPRAREIDTSRDEP